MLNLANERAVVMVFTLPDCPACHEYVPRFTRVAQKYLGYVPVVVIDANHDRNQPLCDRFGIQVTPTTIVAFRPYGRYAFEGAVDDGTIERAFQLALRGY